MTDLRTYHVEDCPECGENRVTLHRPEDVYPTTATTVRADDPSDLLVVVCSYCELHRGLVQPYPPTSSLELQTPSPGLVSSSPSPSSSTPSPQDGDPGRGGRPDLRVRPGIEVSPEDRTWAQNLQDSKYFTETLSWEPLKAEEERTLDGGSVYVLTTDETTELDREVTIIIPEDGRNRRFIANSDVLDVHIRGLLESQLGVIHLIHWVLGDQLDRRGLVLPSVYQRPLPTVLPDSDHDVPGRGGPPDTPSGGSSPPPQGDTDGGGGRPQEGSPPSRIPCSGRQDDPDDVPCDRWFSSQEWALAAGWTQDDDGRWFCQGCRPKVNR